MGYPTPAGPTRRPRSGTSTALAVLAGLLGALGVLLVVLGVVGLSQVATPNMQGFNPGQSIDVGESGMSVYARTDAVRVQSVCTAQGPAGEVVFERPVTTYAVDVAGSDFYEVARSPEGMPSGTYQVTCEGTQDAVYAGPSAPDTTATGLLGPLGLLLGAAFVVLALLAALVAFLARPQPPSTAPTSSGWSDQQPYAAPPPAGPQYGAPPPGYATPHGPDPYTAPSGYSADPWGRAPSGYTPPASDPTQPVPYGQGAYTPAASSEPNGPPGDETPVTDETGPVPSGTGYGDDDSDDSPSGGLGWSPPPQDR